MTDVLWVDMGTLGISQQTQLSHSKCKKICVSLRWLDFACVQGEEEEREKQRTQGEAECNTGGMFSSGSKPCSI